MLKLLVSKKMYENEKEFNNNETTAQRIKRHLNYMARILADSVPENGH